MLFANVLTKLLLMYLNIIEHTHLLKVKVYYKRTLLSFQQAYSISRLVVLKRFDLFPQLPNKFIELNSNILVRIVFEGSKSKFRTCLLNQALYRPY